MLFSLKATDYNALLHCKHLPKPQHMFLERRANIMPSFVSILLMITLSFVIYIMCERRESSRIEAAVLLQELWPFVVSQVSRVLRRDEI